MEGGGRAQEMCFKKKKQQQLPNLMDIKSDADKMAGGFIAQNFI